MEQLSLGDSMLMELVKQGNQQAFNELFLRHNHKIFCYSKKLLAGNTEKAEDITQNVWLKITEKSSFYKSTGHFIAWAFTITRNLITDEFRKKTEFLAQLKNNDDGHVSSVNEQENMEKVLLNLAERIRIQNAIAQLPDMQRLILQIWMNEEISYEDLSLHLNLSLASVKSLLFRARQNIEIILRKKEEGVA